MPSFLYEETWIFPSLGSSVEEPWKSRSLYDTDASSFKMFFLLHYRMTDSMSFIGLFGLCPVGSGIFAGPNIPVLIL